MAGSIRERADACWIASLKYAPVMWNHGRAIGEPIAASGAPVHYLLARDYAWMPGSDRPDVELLPNGNSANPIVSLFDFWRSGALAGVRRAFAKAPPRVIVIVNLNQLVDRLVIRLARRIDPQVRVVLMLHEPFTAGKLVYGWRRGLLLIVFEWLTRGLVKNADGVILPSENALAAYRAHYADLPTEARVIHLPVVDERCTEPLERRYVTFLGQIPHVRQKGLDLFVEMIEESARTGSDSEYQIITGNDPSALLASMSPLARQRVRVVHAVPLSDAEIHRALRASLAIVVLQRRVMQSGAVPMAMMNGTPVIASDLPGLTQFVSHGKTGWVIPVEPDLDTRLRAVEEIRSRMPTINENSRRAFEDIFDSRNVTSHVAWITGTTAVGQIAEPD
jgi:glycosyltransferase involved in cell wall biosynthesis